MTAKPSIPKGPFLKVGWAGGGVDGFDHRFQVAVDGGAHHKHVVSLERRRLIGTTLRLMGGGVVFGNDA